MAKSMAAKGIKPRKLTIDREINDVDIWHVEVYTPKKTMRMPCGKTDLKEMFDLGTGDWNVTVLGVFRGGSPLTFEKFNNNK